MRVFLFDIDGTLICTGGAGRLAMAGAFTDLFGDCDRGDGVPFSGRTDRAIARDLFRAHDIPETEENWRAFRGRYLERLSTALTECKGKVLPGIERLLGRLERETDVLVGLLTGNLSEGAGIKLGHYGLQDRFAFGGFGDERFERNDVAAAALAAARAKGGREPTTVWVVGDTPHDVTCARHIGAKVAAVATGLFSTTELAAENPDLVLADFSAFTEDLPLLRP
ncbi:MAG TPA: HAD family hydrolase [Planctomycetia bacterium]|nr:HAD family hydrolase [Planctomycetia bacterium]